MNGDMAGVVLAGGQGRRLGGADKAGLVIGGRTLLEWTLDALGAAEQVVVVGPHRPVSRRVDAPALGWTREEPPGGGPLAGLRAGLDRVTGGPALVGVLATDHPHVTMATVTRLATAVRVDPASSGAVLTDPDGAPQWLVGVWRTHVLRAAMPEDARGVPVRSVAAALAPVRVSPIGAEASDVDTLDDLRRARGG